MKKLVFFFATLMIFTSSVQAQKLILPRMFSDHMVYQRNEPIKMWGWDSPGQNVAVSLNGSEEFTTTNNDGYWQLYLPAQSAGGPFQIEVQGSEKVIISDVYFGEVWIAGGQSNMEWKLNWVVDGWEDEVANSDYPEIRFFEVENTFSYKKEMQLNSGEWKIANPENSPEFSAVAWYFAKLNHVEKGVPVGIIDSNWGGTPAEAWTPAERLQKVTGYEQEAIEVLSEPNWAQKLELAQVENEKRWARINGQSDILSYGAHEILFDDTDWPRVELPNQEAFTDYIWLRKTISIDAVDDAILSFGNPGKFTIAFLNGEQIYSKGWNNDPRHINIDQTLLKVGENVLAIRTVEDWDNRAFIGSEEEFWISIGNQKIDLSGTWKYSNTIEPPLDDYVLYEHSPGFLYNAMIHPLIGYKIKGVIWYQGESNAGQYYWYKDLFSAMIEEWRADWGQGDFPFLFVQLAAWLPRHDNPTDSDWARLRETQTETLALPNTAMAVTIDIGDAEDIHPRNKKDVGDRLWRAAKKVAYMDDIVHSGPMYLSHKINENAIEITFDYAESGWQNKNSDIIEGFAISGSDSVFHWATAEIDKNMIRVISDQVPNPIAVRYAWADNPKVSLYNREGLPVIPFRTDNW